MSDKKENNKGGKTPRKKEKKAKESKEKEKEKELLIDLQPEALHPRNVHKKSLQIKNCPVENVTVFNDRAEVTRSVKTSLEPGTTELSISGLSSKVDTNSVRVAGGQGQALILEVQHNQRWELKEEDGQTGALKKEIEQLDDKIKNFETMNERQQKEKTWMDAYANSLAAAPRTTSAVPGATSDPTALFQPQAMDQAIAFLDFYQKRLADIDERIATVHASLKHLREQRERQQKALSAVTSGDREQVNEVIVLLSVESDAEIELSLSYVVMGASWTASYDVRVTNGQSKLDVVYYGNITNSTLDDWIEAPLALSTAQPSVGGAPPTLTTKFIGVRVAAPLYNSYGSHARFEQRAVHAAEYSNSSPWAFTEQQDVILADMDERSAPMAMSVLTTDVKDSGTATSFIIPRRSTIMSDNSPHKVTIRMLQLEAHFAYTVIPKLSTHAYLKASICNTNENYPFLAGPINVFMDGNFIAKSNIKAVSPQESFSLYLGVDDGIKVTYPPGVHYKETQGFMRKSHIKTMKHKITLKNTKSTAVDVIVYDQLPKSNDSRIKVQLLEPELKEGDKALHLTEANNLRWKRKLSPGQQIELPFKYHVEWPNDIDVSDF